MKPAVDWYDIRAGAIRRSRWPVLRVIVGKLGGSYELTGVRAPFTVSLRRCRDAKAFAMPRRKYLVRQVDGYWRHCIADHLLRRFRRAGLIADLKSRDYIAWKEFAAPRRPAWQPSRKVVDAGAGDSQADVVADTPTSASPRLRPGRKVDGGDRQPRRARKCSACRLPDCGTKVRQPQHSAPEGVPEPRVAPRAAAPASRGPAVSTRQVFVRPYPSFATPLVMATAGRTP